MATTITTAIERKVKRSAVLLVLALSLFLLYETARLGVSAALEAEGVPAYMEAGLELDPSNAVLRFKLARVYHLLMLEDEDVVKKLYLSSLEHNPLLVSSLLGVTEMYVENGENEKARASLNRAFDLAPFSIGKLWEGSIMALRLGEMEVAARGLRKIAKVDPARRQRVYDVSWLLIRDPEFILDEVIPDPALPSYLGYLISKDELDYTFPVWERIGGADSVPESYALAYVDYLVRRGMAHEAYSIWNEIAEPQSPGSIVWNGGFEDEPRGMGFDWRIHEAEGVAVEFDRNNRSQGSRSLRLSFDGRHNVDFRNVYEYVPVEPQEDYVLRFSIAADGITTRNGVFVEVYCSPRGSMVRSSEPVTGTSGWRVVDLPFHTSADCDSVIIRLRRDKSDKLDRYIAGTVWIDGVEINKVQSDRDDQAR